MNNKEIYKHQAYLFTFLPRFLDARIGKKIARNMIPDMTANVSRAGKLRTKNTVKSLKPSANFSQLSVNAFFSRTSKPSFSGSVYSFTSFRLSVSVEYDASSS